MDIVIFVFLHHHIILIFCLPLDRIKANCQEGERGRWGNYVNNCLINFIPSLFRVLFPYSSAYIIVCFL